MNMKRDHSQIETITSMANCLMLLSHGRDHRNIESIPDRVFECKTCNRQFQSFQALGGHRASHKKPRLTTEGTEESRLLLQFPVKLKTHECSICGLEFAIGQALGGHMRRHRTSSNNHNLHESANTTTTVLPLMDQRRATPVVAVKKSNGGRRSRVLCLDLNLTPYENDLELFKLGRNKAVAAAPVVSNMVDCLSL
ncbi:hypothetical protein Ddye_028539 [Dipteronia dyeriana]|uniref:C2H2-type domain-containing protein n=1 Tax=Dipteronia dyeriana TaxID=168575 RepID=A0AAD9TDG9_9ROSI|nr:hypothetical protein Ddye_028539 [Dipteronia dyeriana]